MFVVISTIVICILFIINALTNVYRCWHFYKLYENYLNEQTAQLCKITVEKKGYKMKVPINSNDAEIHSMPKLTNAICIESNEYSLFFFSINYLGIFQEVLNPFILVKTNEEFYIKDKNVMVVKDFETIETVQNRIINFPKNRYQIVKVIIPRS
jgi:hypothetical protein